GCQSVAHAGCPRIEISLMESFAIGKINLSSFEWETNKMMTSHFGFVAAGLVAIASAGCAADKHESSVESATKAGSAYITTSEPEGAMAVGDARASVADEQQVVLVGRIGGSVEPFVDG